MTEREWWDGIPDKRVDANMADVPAEACLREINERLVIRGRILDLGCGVGRLAVPLARACPGAQIVGVDVSERMLDKARAARGDLPNLSLLLGDGRTLPLVTEFDGAYSMLLFQHLPAQASASYVHQVAAMLKPGARFVYQVVVGPEADTFLSHQCPDVIEPAMWAIDAGLFVEGVTPSKLHDEWYWVQAVK